MKHKDVNKLKIGTIVTIQNTHKNKRVDRDPLWIITNKRDGWIRNGINYYRYELILVSGLYVDEAGKEHSVGYKREASYLRLNIVENVKLINGEIKEVK